MTQLQLPLITTARAGAGAVALALLTGCATVPPGSGSPADPLEGWNRSVFGFNEAVDQAVLKPVAETYRDVLPALVRTGVGNVLGNIADVWSTANQFLQGKFANGLQMGMRVLTNTFFGLGGLLDPATEMRMPRRAEDFGQTLGVWGVGSGPYLVLPFLGPSTVRDTAGLVVDRQTAASTIPNADAGRYAVTALELVNARADLLATGALVDRVALDKYTFFRDAYLARRRDAIYDGAPPMETFDDVGDDPNPTAAPGSKTSATSSTTPASAAIAVPKPTLSSSPSALPVPAQPAASTPR